MTSFPDSYWQTIDDNLLRDTYESDQAMYPAPELTYDRLKSWVDAYPELSFCLQRDQTELDKQSENSENNGAEGLIIMLPLLQPYWGKLVNGEIEEHHIDAAEMFPQSSSGQPQAHGAWQKVQVGLHVFHIERYASFSSTRHGASFTALALDEVRRRVLKAFQLWEVVGYSGKCYDNYTFSNMAHP